MTISEREALKAALDFASHEYTESEFQLNLESAEIRLENGGFGYLNLGMSRLHWSVLIPLRNTVPSVAAFDPDHVIVLVSDDGSKACWFPIM